MLDLLYRMQDFLPRYQTASKHGLLDTDGFLLLVLKTLSGTAIVLVYLPKYRGYDLIVNFFKYSLCKYLSL